MGGKIAAACKPITGILGKQGLSSGGEVVPSLRDQRMKLLKGEALQPALPEEVRHCLAKAVNAGSRHGQDLGQVPGLGEGKGFQGSSSLVECGEVAIVSF